MYASLRRLYGSFVRLCTVVQNVCGFFYVVRILRTFVCVRLLQVKMIVLTYMAFARKADCAYGYGFLVLLTS